MTTGRTVVSDNTSRVIRRAISASPGSNLWPSAVVLPALGLLCLTLSGSEGRAQTSVAIATGSEGGVYAEISDDPSINFKELGRQFTKGRSKAFEDVYFCPGDPALMSTLLNANVEDSDAIIVFADDREPASDEKTIRMIFLLKQIAEEHGKELDVVVELRNVENVKVIEELKKSFPGTLDYVASSNIRTMLLAQCALNRGLSDAYRQLLTATADSCELYTVEIPKTAAGCSFREYRMACAEITSKESVIPIGIGRREDGRLRFAINPLPELTDGKANDLHTLQEGDQLLVIAYDPPKMRDLPSGVRSGAVGA